MLENAFDTRALRDGKELVLALEEAGLAGLFTLKR